MTLLDEIRAAFSDCDGVVLAVSGGLDSMVLLHAFVEALPCSAVVCHVDHGLRKDSAGDRTFVESMASHYQLGFEGVSIDVQKKGSTQNRARCKRLAAIRSVAYQYGYDCISTAHQHDDWVENFYLNTTRGGGMQSLEQRIEHRHDGVRWIRPLTYRTRDEIKQYAVERAISWREDPSNLKTDYTRNKVRAALKETVESHGDGTLASRRRFEDAGIVLQEMLDDVLPSILLPTDHPYSVVLNREALLQQSDAAQHELLRAAVSTLGISTSQAGINEILVRATEGSRVRLTPKDCLVFVEPGDITIMRNFGRGTTWWEALTTQPNAQLSDDLVWFNGAFKWTNAEPRLKRLYKIPASADLSVVGWTPGLELSTTARKEIKERAFGKRWMTPIVQSDGVPIWIPGIWRAEGLTGDRWVSWRAETSTNAINHRTVRS